MLNLFIKINTNVKSGSLRDHTHEVNVDISRVGGVGEISNKLSNEVEVQNGAELLVKIKKNFTTL